MNDVRNRTLLSAIEAIAGSGDVRSVLECIVDEIGNFFDVDRAVVVLDDPSQTRPPVAWSKDPERPSTGLLSLVRQVELELRQSVPYRRDDENAVLAERVVIEQNSALTLLLVADDRQWMEDEAGQLRRVARFAAQAVARAMDHDRLAASEQRYRRLVEHSDAIMFHTDAAHGVTFVSRRALDFFGASPEDFVSEHRVRWTELVHPEDRGRAESTLSRNRTTSFSEEFRVINRVTGRVRWLLVHLVPVRRDHLLGEGGTIEGWDGFGIDITARRDAMEALDIQNKKIRALYTVSSAIRGYLDPANIATRGLAALCDATGAEAGVCYLYPASNPDELEPIASHGFSADQPQEVILAGISGLAAFVSRNAQSLVVPDIGADPRTEPVLLSGGNIRSAVLVPIAAEEEVLGTIGLFSRELSRFDGGTVMLVGAAANQIGLAARQANLFSLYRKQTKNLSALYRMSHELAQNLSIDELFQNAFTIIRDELGLKRLWLGLLSEAGTRIVGQAAYGPGWKRRLVGVNVEIGGRDHPLAKVIATQTPVVIDNPDDVFREFGVKRIFSRMAIHSVALVPLIAGGQVLGVLAVQPGSSDPALHDEQVTLLTSLAAEIAAHLLTLRLEQRIAESEKMRTAGLLASGIAHNFNNVLQAILGQASLVEMQPNQTPRITKASKIIAEAASKGAGLVRQLLSFAQLEESRKEVSDVNDILERNREVFSRSVKANQELILTLNPSLKRALVDPRQLIRIIATLVENACDAMLDGGTVELFTDLFDVDERNPHYEVPFGSYVRVGVRDTGEGMDEETRRRCFEPFFTTKNVDRSSGLGLTGAGLGLAAAYALARRNGGRLVAESRLGAGSVFTLFIPVAREGAVTIAEGVNRLKVEVLRDGEISDSTLPEKGEHPRISR